jgi:hypothetical protein
VRRPALVLTLIAAAAAGCGNERTPAPDVVTPDAPRGTRVVHLDAAGVRFNAPLNWRDLPARGRRAGGIQSKTATVAVWVYPRTEPLPSTKAALEEVKRLLVDRLRRRDPRFELRGSTIGRRGGANAIEVLGRQTIAGLPFGVRSAHLYARRTEVVVDAYAPPESFDRLDAGVFVPLLGSLKLKLPQP